MTFHYKVEVPTVDGKATEMVVLEFKDIDQLPIGIMRKFRNDNEAQMWETFEWGLSPEHLELFDRLPAVEIEKIMEEWSTSSEEIVAKIEAAQAKAVAKGKAAAPDAPAEDKDNSEK